VIVCLIAHILVHQMYLLEIYKRIDVLVRQIVVNPIYLFISSLLFHSFSLFPFTSTPFKPFPPSFTLFLNLILSLSLLLSLKISSPSTSLFQTPPLSSSCLSLSFPFSTFLLISLTVTSSFFLSIILTLYLPSSLFLFLHLSSSSHSTVHK
jgi:hypothetical protein